jgi:hypothetical protein
MSLNVTPKFDAASSSGYEASLSTYNWNHTVGLSLPNRCLILSVSILVAGSVSDANFGGQAFSLVRADASGVYRTEIWRLVNPAVGTAAITVNLSGSLTSIANASSYYNVDPTSPIHVQNTGAGTGNPASASVTTTQRLATVVGALTTQTGSGVTSGGSQNSRAINAGALGTGALDDSIGVDPAGATTLTWNGIIVANTWVISLIALNPAPTPSLRSAFTRPRAFAPGHAR